MQVLVTTEARVHLGRDGSWYALSPNGYPFWKRYLSVFDEVVVIARGFRETEPIDYANLPEYQRVEGPGVRLEPLDPVSFRVSRLWNIGASSRPLQKMFSSYAASPLIFRSPGLLSAAAAGVLRSRPRVYGIELVGDPRSCLSHILPFGLRRLAHFYLTERVGNLVRGATAVCTVSKTLDEAFGTPCSHRFVSSSIILDDHMFAPSPRRYERGDGPRFVTVATLVNPIKRIDQAIDCLGVIRETYPQATLTVVGGGKLLQIYERHAAKRNLSGAVTFAGSQSPQAVGKSLDEADFFLFTSHSEGLPRAILEAMAKGLPCAAYGVGGIPEILSPEQRQEERNPAKLAQRVVSILQDSHLYTRLSASNLEMAGSYRSETLQRIRIAFWSTLRSRAGTAKGWAQP